MSVDRGSLEDSFLTVAEVAEMLKLNQHLVTCPATILEYYVAKHFQEMLAINPDLDQATIARKNVSAIQEHFRHP